MKTLLFLLVLGAAATMVLADDLTPMQRAILQTGPWTATADKDGNIEYICSFKGGCGNPVTSIPPPDCKPPAGQSVVCK